MSRVAKSPVVIPAGVTVTLQDNNLTVKGTKSSLALAVNSKVVVNVKDNEITFEPKDGSVEANALSGTVRALVHNMVVGVTKGYERKLTLVGVGYRAQAKGNVLNLSLGFSHPVEYKLPEGITCETPSNTEIVLKGADKTLIGQVAANIRAYRSPEPYKGKGVRYATEIVHIKEAKKK
ncbi:MAG: 50S ribosomal protein L6 [Succinivibrionaceae bacterium]|nr:50S ribosomal protein L6 [Succinivibrionaceae bacterium]